MWSVLHFCAELLVSNQVSSSFVAFTGTHVFFSRGGYAKPDIRDVLWVKIVCLPYHIFLFIRFHIRWIWRYNYKKLEFEEADKLYLVQKNLKYTHTQYESLPEKEKKEFTDKKLWITENFNVSHLDNW